MGYSGRRMGRSRRTGAAPGGRPTPAPRAPVARQPRAVRTRCLGAVAPGIRAVDLAASISPQRRVPVATAAAYHDGLPAPAREATPRGTARSNARLSAPRMGNSGISSRQPHRVGRSAWTSSASSARLRTDRSAPAECDTDETQRSSFRPPDPRRGERARSLDVRAGEHVGPAIRTRRRQRQPHIDRELRQAAQALPRHRLPTFRMHHRQMRPEKPLTAHVSTVRPTKSSVPAADSSQPRTSPASSDQWSTSIGARTLHLNRW